MNASWFDNKKKRKYQHFDVPVGTSFALKVEKPQFVKKHAFSPLIHYEKEEIRYKKCAETGIHKTTVKARPIKYASHKDACILSFYAHSLNDKLDDYYFKKQLSEHVIAYRALGKGNYDFSAEAYRFAKDQKSPVTILAFDVTGFFDNLDHARLKTRLKQLLGVSELPEDWYKVFRFMTRFHYVQLKDLKAHADFGLRMLKKKRQVPIATIAELKKAAITIHSNPSPGRGIPQGTPISATFSNLYMVDFDEKAKDICHYHNALYRRYSDDILVICPKGHATAIEDSITRLMKQETLSLNVDKTERTQFNASAPSPGGTKAAQYLGFKLNEQGASIRESSLARQYRKMKRAFRRIRKVAQVEINAGRANKAWTKRLRRRFTGLPFRNFSSYGRRSAKAFGADQSILHQIRRFERAAERELKKLEDLSKPVESKIPPSP